VAGRLHFAYVKVNDTSAGSRYACYMKNRELDMKYPGSYTELIVARELRFPGWWLCALHLSSESCRLYICNNFLQCVCSSGMADCFLDFDIVGWVTGRALGLLKILHQ